ncbi:MAG: DUF1565 domain-containing protein, partial [Planctomycetota bacterium]
MFSSERLVLVLSLLLAHACLVEAGTILVPQDQPTVQDAIDAAVNGDVVQVSPGTYVENINFLGKAITVTSSDGPEVTIIDGNMNGPVVTFASGEALDSVLEGLQIINGSGNPDNPAPRGGGIFCSLSSPTIANNIITENSVGCPVSHSSFGGGIYCESSSPTITGNTLSNNISREGGGIYCIDASPIIENNIIHGNSCGPGGAVGGGIVSVFSSSPWIIGNVITENGAILGGGIACVSLGLEANPIISDNL